MTLQQRQPQSMQGQEQEETMVGADNWDVPSPVALQSGSKQVGEEDGALRSLCFQRCNSRTRPSRHHASTFFRKEQPSVNRARPPLGVHSESAHAAHMTTVVAWEYTVVMVKHPGHRTSMK